nr:ATP-binding protein [Leucobacter weissii]
MPPDLAPPRPADLLERLLDRAGRPARVLIDGPSGSGKTALALMLRERIGDGELLHLDDLYGGWDGLERVGRSVASSVIEPLSRGEAGRVRVWDWTANAPGEWRAFAPDRTLIVEGSGSLTRAAAPSATLRLWLDLEDEPERRRRALARSGGELYRPHWEHWAAQERAHARRERPRELADLVLRPARHPGDPVYTIVDERG